MAGDPRAMVASRATGYLVSCGPTYFEPVLAADEARIKDKATTRVALNAYQQACVPAADATPPTPEQCTRLKQLLTTVLHSGQFESATRAKSLDDLRLNFPTPETLKLAKTYARDADRLLVAKASEVITQLQNDLARPAASDTEPRKAVAVPTASTSSK
jgi:hypothetical protein